MLVEQIDQPGKVGQRSGQAVDLVDDDDVDPAFPDIFQQGLKGSAICGPSREADILLAFCTRQ